MFRTFGMWMITPMTAKRGQAICIISRSGFSDEHIPNETRHLENESNLLDDLAGIIHDIDRSRLRVRRNRRRKPDSRAGRRAEGDRVRCGRTQLPGRGGWQNRADELDAWSGIPGRRKARPVCGHHGSFEEQALWGMGEYFRQVDRK